MVLFSFLCQAVFKPCELRIVTRLLWRQTDMETVGHLVLSTFSHQTTCTPTITSISHSQTCMMLTQKVPLMFCPKLKLFKDFFNKT